MKDAKKQGNYDTNIPLVPAKGSGDTKYEMYPAELPKLDYLRHVLDSIVARRPDCQPGSRIWLAAPFFYAKALIRFWWNTRRVESLARRSDKVWKRFLSTYRSSKQPFAISNDWRSEFRNRCEENARDLGEILSDLAITKEVFPRLSARMRIAVERMNKVQCDYMMTLFMEDDQAMIASAERHYMQGTLMDLETFANGLQRH